MHRVRHRIIVIGGGHAGAEAAWAAANLLPEADFGRGAVALVTLDPARIGVMSCNPAIGGLAKGQLVREIDALAGLMPLAADAAGIQFKVLNATRGPAVHGPRCQADKHVYAETVRALLASRPEIAVVAGSVERLLLERRPGATPRITGVDIASPDGPRRLEADAVVLTTGTFLRGLMHTGETRTPGGRVGEAAATTLSDTLRELGFELGRLKTGTPPRLRRASIDWHALPEDLGDAHPMPFSSLHEPGLLPAPFPSLPQVDCRQTRTSPEAHEHIRANLHRAPMFNEQITSAGPRYCPSIEDKVVRFADRDSHGVYLEPESLRSDWIYCNGISSSLPADVQDIIVRTMPGCENAEILRYGYAVEYDMVRPHQIDAACHCKLVRGLFLAGQINGTSGYEEAAAQGILAGINAARLARAEPPRTLARDEAYIGVLMDDLVTRTPLEPYRMFTSRAEHRLLLRADNAIDRLGPIAAEIGLLQHAPLAQRRRRLHQQRVSALPVIRAAAAEARIDDQPLERLLRRHESEWTELRAALPDVERRLGTLPDSVWRTAHADIRYEPYIARDRATIRRNADADRRQIPPHIDYALVPSLSTEAREALSRFRPTTLGQAGRLEGLTPADITLLRIALARLGPAHAPDPTPTTTPNPTPNPTPSPTPCTTPHRAAEELPA